MNVYCHAPTLRGITLRAYNKTVNKKCKILFYTKTKARKLSKTGAEVFCDFHHATFFFCPCNIFNIDCREQL